MSFLLDFFKRRILTFDVIPLTIYDSFGMKKEKFDSLLMGLFGNIGSEDRTGSLKRYLSSPMFHSLQINKNEPNNAFLIGFCFATALYQQREVEKAAEANAVLKHFSSQGQEIDPEEIDKKN